MLKSLISGTALSLVWTASVFAADLPGNRRRSMFRRRRRHVDRLLRRSERRRRPSAPTTAVTTTGGRSLRRFQWRRLPSSRHLSPTPRHRRDSMSFNSERRLHRRRPVGYNYQFYNAFVAGSKPNPGRRGLEQNGNVATRRLRFLPPPIAAIAESRPLPGGSITRHRARPPRLSVTPTLLAYATGGLAYGGVKSEHQPLPDDHWANRPLRSPFHHGRFGYSDTRAGWTVGGGMEWMFAPRVERQARISLLRPRHGVTRRLSACLSIGFVGTARAAAADPPPAVSAASASTATSSAAA